MTAFEQSQTWDELIKFFVDNYVVEQDKQKVTDFYDRAYITEKLKGLETELRQECRIVLNGEERWVSNVVMRGEIGDSDYAMSFCGTSQSPKQRWHSGCRWPQTTHRWIF